MAPRRSGLRLGRYELGAKIASGGMGEVFQARQVGAGAFEKDVALKLLLPRLAEQPQFVRMFLDEARIAARMNHPNIVQIFDVGHEAGRYFIAMSLVEGSSLHRLLQAGRAAGVKLPLPVVRLIALGLTAGLGYAHELTIKGRPAGVLHRDVTPSNVLLSTSGAVLLSDFGIAKALDSVHWTEPGALRGKHGYLSPEALRGQPLDARADLYAASVTLAEAVLGAPPFSLCPPGAELDAPLLQQHRPDAEPELIEALLRGLAQDPNARFHSARAMREAWASGPVALPDQLGVLVHRLHAPQPRSVQDDGVGPTGTAQAGTRRWWLPAGGVGAAAAIGLAAWAVTTAEAPVPVETAPPPASAVVGPSESRAAPARPPPHAPEPGPAPRREPTRQTRPPPAKKTKIGYLSADATPWASLVVKGREVITTPISRYPLPVGEHVVVFRNPNLGREVKRTIRIEEGKVSTLKVDLSQ